MQRFVGLIAVAVIAVGCAQQQAAAPEATQDTVELLAADISHDPYEPDIDPANFGNDIDNPYLPLVPGTTLNYQGKTDEGTETIEYAVTDETKEVMGIECVVVRDTVRLDGELVEQTDDWFAQDDDGNVWYMGEYSTDYENGKVKDHGGSWEAGVDGAYPGIVMPAEPTVGQHYRQEYYEGEAEDTGEILEVGVSTKSGGKTYDDVVVTEDRNLLEPDIVEQKYYARGIGVVKEDDADQTVELVEIEKP